MGIHLPTSANPREIERSTHELGLANYRQARSIEAVIGASESGGSQCTASEVRYSSSAYWSPT